MYVTAAALPCRFIFTLTAATHEIYLVLNVTYARCDCLLPSSCAQPSHHRFFWREETTTASLWEGTRQAIGPGAAAATNNRGRNNASSSASPTRHEEEDEKEGWNQVPQDGDDRKEEEGKTPVLCGINDNLRATSPAASIIRDVSARSDLAALSRLLADGKVNPACAQTFTAALRESNPAVVEMILNHGKRRGDPFLDAFLSWGDATDAITAERPLLCFPLHASCHSGSPEILSVLLRFMVECYSREDRRDMVNAKDLHGRTALHMASWSPHPQCPGRRHEIMR